MLYRIFNIYPCERNKTLLFTILGFIWSLGTSLGFILSDGLFLEKIGTSNLPLAYILTSVALFAFAFFFLWVINNYHINKIYSWFTASAILFYLILFFLHTFAFKFTPIWIVFKIFANLFFIVLTSCFWTFVDQYFGLQIAKRLYCLFYSAVFLGTGCSGFLVSISVDYFTLKSIFAFIILTLVISIVLIKIISKKIPALEDDLLEESLSSGKFEVKQFLLTIISSRFTFYFLIGNILIHTLVVVTEFNYMNVLENTFTSNPGLNTSNKLTSFLGQLNIWVSIGNILFTTLIYSRLINRIGLSNMVLVVPISFLSIFCAWVFQNYFFIAILGFIAIEGILPTIDDNNFILLLNAVPSKFKNKIRIASESLFEPIGMLLSALLLLLCQANSKLLGLALSFVFLSITLAMKTFYTKGILDNLASHSIQFGQKSKNWLKNLSWKERLNLLANLKKQKKSQNYLLLKKC